MVHLYTDLNDGAALMFFVAAEEDRTIPLRTLSSRSALC
jgi:hypothetical protein